MVLVSIILYKEKVIFCGVWFNWRPGGRKKFFQKGIDKRIKVWYNMITKEERK
jgi:hypothetical protein